MLAACPAIRRTAEKGDSGGGQRKRYERCRDDCGALAGGENVALQAQRYDRGRDAELGGRGNPGPERLPGEPRREGVHGDVERVTQRRERDDIGPLPDNTQVYASAEVVEEVVHHGFLRNSGALPCYPFCPAD